VPVNEEEARKKLAEYEEMLKKSEKEVIEIKRHRIFRHEFLDVIAYRFVELF